MISPAIKNAAALSLLLSAVAAHAGAPAASASCNPGIGACSQRATPVAASSGNPQRIIETRSSTPTSPGPAAIERGVYITQIGDSNRAVVRQGASIATTRVNQNGDNHAVEVEQRGAATAYADVRQAGLQNDASITQRGTVGGNAVLLLQSGTGNVARVAQSADDMAENSAAIAQYGSGNIMALVQDGADNLAQLNQQGEGNVMTASQTGSGNRLVWSQLGDNLSGLAISQTGGQALQVTQGR